MSLADLSAFIRSSVRWFLISLAVLFLLCVTWIVIQVTSGYIIKPKGEDIAFGKLPVPFFVKAYSSLKTSQSELATSLPKSKEKAPVFEFKLSNKFSEEQINKIASYLGFSASSQKKTGNMITWGSSSETVYLKLNTSQSHFTYRYNFSKESSSAEKISLEEKPALGKTKEILQQLELLPEDISKGTSIVQYLKISSGKREQTTAAAANALEVSLFRKISDGTSSGDAPIKLLFGPSYKILEFDYNYSPVDPLGSPYPIITSQEAWQTFQEGEAYTSTQIDFDSVVVTKVSLSHWESSLPQKYLQPVWIFVGKGRVGGDEKEFTAVCGAVSSSFLSN